MAHIVYRNSINHCNRFAQVTQNITEQQGLLFLKITGLEANLPGITGYHSSLANLLFSCLKISFRWEIEPWFSERFQQKCNDWHISWIWKKKNFALSDHPTAWTSRIIKEILLSICSYVTNVIELNINRDNGDSAQCKILHGYIHVHANAMENLSNLASGGERKTAITWSFTIAGYW